MEGGDLDPNNMSMNGNSPGGGDNGDNQYDENTMGDQVFQQEMNAKAKSLAEVKKRRKE